MSISFDSLTDVECQGRKILSGRVVRIDCFIDYRWNNVIPLRRLAIMRLHLILAGQEDFITITALTCISSSYRAEINQCCFGAKISSTMTWSLFSKMILIRCKESSAPDSMAVQSTASSTDLLVRPDP